VSIKYKAEFFFEKKQTKDMKRERGKENIEPEIRVSLIQLPHHLGKSLKKGVNTSV